MLINLFISQKFVHGSHEEGRNNAGGIRISIDKSSLDQFSVSCLLGGMGRFLPPLICSPIWLNWAQTKRPWDLR